MNMCTTSVRLVIELAGDQNAYGQQENGLNTIWLALLACSYCKFMLLLAVAVFLRVVLSVHSFD